MEIAGETIEIDCECGRTHEIELGAYLWNADGEIQKEFTTTYDAMGVPEE